VVRRRISDSEILPEASVPGPTAGPRQELTRPSLGVRLRALWKIKLVATPVLMTAFFVAYFFVLKSPLFPVRIMPLTPIDDFVAFVPQALPLYLSLWIYLMLALTLIMDRRELFIYGQAVIGLAVVGLGFFLVYPTAVPPPQIDWSQYPAFEFLKTVDATGNACPSLHVAFAIFSAMWLHRLVQVLPARGLFRLLSWSWCLAIIYSTVATKQHVAIDVVAGAALGAAAAAHGLWRVSKPVCRLSEARSGAGR
jgi:membrane-associated phospholipid phosphatase